MFKMMADTTKVPYVAIRVFFDTVQLLEISPVLLEKVQLDLNMNDTSAKIMIK